MNPYLVLVISQSARTRKAIKDIIESRESKYSVILQDDPYRGAIEINLRNPRCVIIDGQIRKTRDPIALVYVLAKNRPDLPIIFFDEFAHISLEAKRAGATKILSRPRLDDEKWMEWWSGELMDALEKLVT